MSLLAKFFNQIKSSQEDIASDGLKHILQNSIYAKNYLKNSIFTKTNIELPELNYTNQISKTELGRTDISGCPDRLPARARPEDGSAGRR